MIEYILTVDSTDFKIFILSKHEIKSRKKIYVFQVPQKPKKSSFSSTNWIRRSHFHFQNIIHIIQYTKKTYFRCNGRSGCKRFLAMREAFISASHSFLLFVWDATCPDSCSSFFKGGYFDPTVISWCIVI